MLDLCSEMPPSLVSVILRMVESSKSLHCSEKLYVLGVELGVKSLEWPLM